ncbi:MAG: hypothetical protein C0508_30795 [Cyanobacteria bacterium PR.023]|nr:hypothetical protein [Cyanobacteria bacterium PR.023]
MDEEDYEVGYRRPPKHTRFKKGVSGNPSGGRKKPEQAIAGVLEAVLNEKIRIGMHGKKQRVRKIDVLIRKLINRALEDDFKSVKLLFDMSKQFGLHEKREESHEEWVKRFNAEEREKEQEV